VTGGAGGAFTYTPNADFNGSDSFVVTVSDGNGGSVQQTVNITVAAVDEASVITGIAPITVENDGSDAGSFAGPISVSDADTANYNGGSLTIATDGFFTGLQAITVDSGNFYRLGNSLVAESTFLGTATDLVIGTITDLFTDRVGGATGVLDGNEATGIRFDFTSSTVTPDVVEALLTALHFVDPNAANATDVAVTITLSHGGVDTVVETTIEVVPAPGDLAITELGGDDREVQVGAAANPITLDLGNNANLDANNIDLSGTTLSIAAGAAGDVLGLVNTTNAGINGQARFIGTSVAVQSGGIETIIGSVAGIPGAGGGCRSPSTPRRPRPWSTFCCAA
jgi:hypothetical protein